MLIVNKPVGLTPYQVVQKIKSDNPNLVDKKIGYAGRLDPMAEGVLILLVGSENKNKKEYEKLPKTYEFKILFGLSTDTYDVLGIPKIGSEKSISKSDINIYLKGLMGKQTQKYPPYSSPKVDGKPLFKRARENKINNINIPSKIINIYNIKLISSRKIYSKNLHKLIKNKIDLVDGDFRQEKILKAWDKLLSKSNTKNYQVIKCKINCSSGTYVRSIANEAGKHFGVGAIAFSIKRTSVGKYVSLNSGGSTALYSGGYKVGPGRNLPNVILFVRK